MFTFNVSRLFALFTALLAIMANPSQVLAAQAEQPLCRKIFSAPTQSYASISEYSLTAVVQKFESDSRFDVSAYAIPGSTRPRSYKITVTDRATNRVAGFRYYQFDSSQPDRIHVKRVEVDPAFQNQGISRYLTAKMLIDHPTARFIEAELDFDNLAAFRAGEGRSSVERLKGTPFYKVFSKFGFDEIIEVGARRCPYAGDCVVVVLYRKR